MLNSTSFTGSRCQVVNELRDPALDCLLLLCERVVVDSRRQGQNQVWQQQQCGRQSVESWKRAKSTRISLVNRIKKEVYSHDRGQRSRSFQLPMLHSKQVAAAAALFPHFSPPKLKKIKNLSSDTKRGETEEFLNLPTKRKQPHHLVSFVRKFSPSQSSSSKRARRWNPFINPPAWLLTGHHLGCARLTDYHSAVSASDQRLNKTP